ncbi:hypothetical protein DV515_00013883, partial [Chloebia gouldiae]
MPGCAAVCAGKEQTRKACRRNDAQSLYCPLKIAPGSQQQKHCTTGMNLSSSEAPGPYHFLTVSSDLLELDLNYDETHQSSHPALACGKTLPGLDPFAASFFQLVFSNQRNSEPIP